MHAAHPGALFQAASQFNCLEFASPHAVPEQGVTIYEDDGTQGPACALACAAGTVYRNYLVSVASCSSRSKGGGGGGDEGDAGGKDDETVVRHSDALAGRGQTRDSQINNLDALEDALDNGSNNYWSIENGYR